MDETIFVQIASYKDNELKPTIKDILIQARYPENLYFGICWQHGDDENLDEYLNHPKFRILDVNWKESKGVCWARSEIQKLYHGEKYTLQLDSHHRFVKDWDVLLLDMFKGLQSDGYAKPIITTYGGVYDPYHPKIFLDSRPFKIVADRNFTADGILLFHPAYIENWQKLTKPIPARFISGHFYFTLGQHCIECPYDPNLYFAGEEISLSVRSYTLGYDIFHPHRLILYHEYTRKNRTKHWDDYSIQNKKKGDVDFVWSDRDQISKKRIRQLLQEEDNGIDLGPYGLGKVRCLQDYEKYAGINFKHRQIQDYTIKGNNPPNPLPHNKHWYLVKKAIYQVTMRWDKTLFDPNMDYQFWLFAVEDETGASLVRQDVMYEDKTKILFSEVCEKKITVEVKENIILDKYVIWPYSKTKQWLKKYERKISPTDIQRIK